LIIKNQVAEKIIQKKNLNIFFEKDLTI